MERFERDRSCDIRIIVFSPLSRPSVLIGGFNNPWTLELTKGLPYSFRQGSRIQDQDHPERVWISTQHNSKGTADDYALI
jgi:hypothetical protein